MSPLASRTFEYHIDKQIIFNVRTSSRVELEKRKHCEVYDAINSVFAEAHETLAIFNKELSNSATYK